LSKAVKFSHKEGTIGALLGFGVVEEYAEVGNVTSDIRLAL
jgi:hypothetical protein